MRFSTCVGITLGSHGKNQVFSQMSYPPDAFFIRISLKLGSWIRKKSCGFTALFFRKVDRSTDCNAGLILVIIDDLNYDPPLTALPSRFWWRWSYCLLCR